MVIVQLGRQAGLSRAELESVYGAKAITPFGVKHVLVDTEELDLGAFGGSIRCGKVLKQTTVEHEQQILQELIQAIRNQVKGSISKVNAGISIWGVNLQAKHLLRELFGLKNALKQSGHRVRIVNTKDIRLNSATVFHNKLTTEPNVELTVIAQGDDLIIARTTQVQDIDEYTIRDRERPKRDAKVGMLPPKLAQMMLNIAQVKPGNTVLDPFCGTGVVLQEAILKDCSVYGSDISPRMVEYSQANLDWLKKKRDFNTSVQLEPGDAATHQWELPIDAVVSETYLGTAMHQKPDRAAVEREIKEINPLLTKTLENLHKQIQPNTRLVLAVPAWPNTHEIKHLPVLDQLGSLGYNRVSFTHATTEELVYHRPNQHVARELIILTRKS